MLYSFVRESLYWFFRMFFGLEVVNRGILPDKTPFLLACNHVSNFDPPVIGAAFPYRLYYLAKAELFETPFSRWLFNQLCAIPLRRQGSDISALRKALKVLKARPLVVFPQGTRSENLAQFKAGVGFLYKKTGVKVFAARIYGTDKILPKGTNKLKKGKIKVVFSPVEGLSVADTPEIISEKIFATIKSL